MAVHWRLRPLAVLLVLVLVAGGTVPFAEAEEGSSFGERLGNAKDSVVETVKNVLPGNNVEEEKGSNSWVDWAVDRINLLADSTQKKIIESYETESASKSHYRVLDAAVAAKESTEETLRTHFSQAGAKLFDAQNAAVDTTLQTYETVKHTSISVLERLGLKEKPKPEKTYTDIVTDAIFSAKDSVTTTASDATEYVRLKAFEASESASQTYGAASEGFNGYASDASDVAKAYAADASEKLESFKDSVTRTSRDAYFSVKEKTVGLSEEEKPDEGLVSSIQGKANEYVGLAGEQATALKDSATEMSISAKEYASSAGEKLGETYDSAKETSKDYVRSAGEKLGVIEKPEPSTTDSVFSAVTDSATASQEKLGEIYDSTKQTVTDSAAAVGQKTRETVDSVKGYISGKDEL